MDKEICGRTVRYAAEIVEGYQQLARHLGVTRTEVKEWAAETRMPGPVAFLLVLDLIAAETRKLSDEAMAMALARAAIAKVRRTSKA
jgi:hypothetical protein